jgi:putative membrane protein
MTIQDLPLINACLNALATVFLTLGFIHIKRGNKITHRNCMISAFVTSAVFLTCYLIYHYNTGSTKFVEPAWFKPIYLTILITHIILAVVILPLIFMTLSRALKERFPQHKKIAKWTWPLWMYVSITGVLIYLLLYQIFPQPKPAPTPPSIAEQPATE